MNDLTHFLKRLKRITLSDNERLALRERLALYAEMNPVMAPLSVPNTFFSFIASGRFSTYALSLLLLIAAGGGATLGAEGSVPGDSLYALKVNVNEPLMTALATTPTTQARVAADIATRRIDEAVTLASRGKLTQEKQEYLSKEFSERVKVATEKADQLATLDSDAADTVKANLAANLAGEAQALGAVSKEGKKDAGDLFTIVVAAGESIVISEDVALATTATTTDSTAAGATTMAAVAPMPYAKTKNSGVFIQNVRLSGKKNASTTPTVTNTAAATSRVVSPTRTTTTFFSGRFASTTLKTFLMPKTDVAIPKQNPSAAEDDESFRINR